ncbi:hypothetical protein HMJ29_00530 [Hymenobacter taeanensis]|uniref:Glutaminyl-tRNA synthetase n=1 Tax=Hymenobacter taeanensis TaxID=2735321 RepID=A0A6M6BE35_9BACT|nr:MULTISPECIES: DUF6370 family protein [Hymenobacter]QJX45503.1 hypothetical protein HMJ29_00530 [Hymenobacter taeanensis]UOQ81250.1 DUF6370 family protein [Hymenobacter sp. 5414T-23]
MKVLLLLLSLSFATVTVRAQSAPAPTTATPDPAKKLQVVDAACGQCRLGLPGKSCDLAVRVNGKAYFVDGTDIDSHGDAHAKDGLCNSVRKAQVQGEVVDNRFKATYFQLLPETAKVK